MKMGLVVLLCISYPLLQDVLGLLHKLTMQINCVVGNSAIGIVLSENEIRGLLIVLVHLCAVGFALLRQVVGGSSITALVRLTRLYSDQKCAAQQR